MQLTEEQRDELSFVGKCDPSFLIRSVKDNTNFDAKVLERVFDLAKERAAELLAAHNAGAQEHACNNEECNWHGPLSETSQAKHGFPNSLCPQCHETTELMAPPRTTDAARDMGKLWPEEEMLFLATIYEFQDCNETSTDYHVLLDWVNRGLLDCERFITTAAGNAEIERIELEGGK